MTNKLMINFGKYNGKTIEEVMEADGQYIEWLLNQGWFSSKFPELYEQAINNGQGPDETPEHNALQAKLLDEGFCRRILRCVINKDTSIKSIEIEFEPNGFDAVIVAGLVSENDDYNDHTSYFFFPIEIKTSMGDDYPTVLRQMKRGVDILAGQEVRIKGRVLGQPSYVTKKILSYKGKYSYGCSMLLLEQYSGRGVDIDQVKTIFQSSHIRVLMLDETM